MAGALSQEAEQAAGCEGAHERAGDLQGEALGQAHLVHVREPLCILRHRDRVWEWRALAPAAAAGFMPCPGPR